MKFKTEDKKSNGCSTSGINKNVSTMALVPVTLEKPHLISSSSFSGLIQKDQDITHCLSQMPLANTILQENIGQWAFSSAASGNPSLALLAHHNNDKVLKTNLAPLRSLIAHASEVTKLGFIQLTALPGVIHTNVLCNQIALVNTNSPNVDSEEMSLVPFTDCFAEEMTSLGLLKQFIAEVNPRFRFNTNQSVLPRRVAGLVPSCLFPLWNDVFFDLRSNYLPVTRNKFDKPYGFPSKKEALSEGHDFEVNVNEGDVTCSDTDDNDLASQTDNSGRLKNRIVSIFRRLLHFYFVPNGRISEI